MITKMKATEVKVCVFCDCTAEYQLINGRLIAYCPECNEYKGLMTVEDWEDYTGQKWEWQ